jgi:hypothetical protein
MYTTPKPKSTPTIMCSLKGDKQMKITFTRKNRNHIVTVNGTPYTFDTLRDALVFVDALRKEVA